MLDTGARTAPFLRWAGSKRWLVDEIRAWMPDAFRKYYEPFLGSGAIYFSCVAPKPAVLGDAIEPLINTYIQVRDEPMAVLRAARKWPVDETSYYQVRQIMSDDPVTRAAQFIYLNKTCFNGLYRENQQGRFNVPFGRPKTSNIVDEITLTRVSQHLRTAGTELAVRDFEESLDSCGPGDVAYLDPPYVAGHRQNGFVDYNAKLFSWDDQRRLASVCLALHRKGTSVLISNADHPSVRELFDHKEFQLVQVSRYSSMAARSGKRGASDELLILSQGLTRRPSP